MNKVCAWCGAIIEPVTASPQRVPVCPSCHGYVVTHNTGCTWYCWNCHKAFFARRGRPADPTTPELPHHQLKTALPRDLSHGICSVCRVDLEKQCCSPHPPHHNDEAPGSSGASFGATIDPSTRQPIPPVTAGRRVRSAALSSFSHPTGHAVGALCPQQRSGRCSAASLCLGAAQHPSRTARLHLFPSAGCRVLAPAAGSTPAGNSNFLLRNGVNASPAQW